MVATRILTIHPLPLQGCSAESGSAKILADVEKYLIEVRGARRVWLCPDELPDLIVMADMPTATSGEAAT